MKNMRLFNQHFVVVFNKSRNTNVFPVLLDTYKTTLG